METLLFELLISGFFAVACIRACVPANPGGKLAFSDLFRFPGRLERLQRTRWQWFSMVAVLLILRLQIGIAPGAGSDCCRGIRDFHGVAGEGKNDGRAKGRQCGNCGKSLISSARCGGKCGSARFRARRCGCCAWSCATTLLECDWITRPPDAWDSSLRRPERDRNESRQILLDAIAMRDLVFDALPKIDCAVLRAFRQPAREPPEIILLGTVSREMPEVHRVSSLAMRAKLYRVLFHFGRRVFETFASRGKKRGIHFLRIDPAGSRRN